MKFELKWLVHEYLGRQLECRTNAAGELNGVFI